MAEALGDINALQWVLWAQPVAGAWLVVMRHRWSMGGYSPGPRRRLAYAQAAGALVAMALVLLFAHIWAPQLVFLLGVCFALLNPLMILSLWRYRYVPRDIDDD